MRIYDQEQKSNLKSNNESFFGPTLKMMKMFSRSKESRGVRGRSIMSFDDFQYTAVNELVFNLNDDDIHKSASKSH